MHIATDTAPDPFGIWKFRRLLFWLVITDDGHASSLRFCRTQKWAHRLVAIGISCEAL
ncbi:hypothetical protein SAMN05444392_102160 [Seinonella peptonophila]|uniref:Uncharacterized protein n=1 Tax=Seinonella peptonophila TaxID=112248 RepID=A0A1M4V4F0_9BACL|nr:hypothetical protein [Seinonella peptonophila]SHE63763.1 hypothetical protein SAMN05444392_102160 [Seinonella peptonophila]